MSHPVVHFEIAGEDAGALQSFYRDAFGWSVDSNNPMNYGFVKTGGEEGIGGGMLQGQGPMSHYVTVYVRVPDVGAHLRKVESLGGKTVVPPTDLPNGGQFAMFSDVAGNVLGLYKG
jgi:uncharacterized protein